MSVLQKEKFSCACGVRGRRVVGEAGRGGRRAQHSLLNHGMIPTVVGVE